MFRGRNAYRGGRGSSSSRGNRGNNSSSSRTARTAKGLFADGIWMCDCTPRLPAEHFKVKKEGPNKDRWFYTCQQSEPKRCGFFLWDEDARPREEAAVLSGKRTEPMGRQSEGGEVQEGWSAGRAQRAAQTDAMSGRGRVGGRGLFGRSAQKVKLRNGGRVVEQDEETQSPSPRPRSISPPPLYTAAGHGAPANNAAKRNAQAAFAEEDEEDFFPWPLTGQEEQELAKKADNVIALPQTPHKALKTGVYATPATTAKRKLPWLEQEPALKVPGVATARGAKTADGHLETPSKRLGPVSPITEEHSASTATPSHVSAQHTTAPATTPSPPTRYKDALHNPADASSSLTSEALFTLSALDIPPEIREKLRSILSRHDLKLQGITKGRDISRLAIKAKDAKIKELETKIVGLENAKIAELQTRIASLEAEREVDRAVVRQLRSQQTSIGEEDVDSQETVA